MPNMATQKWSAVALVVGLCLPPVSVGARQQEPQCDWQIGVQRVDVADAELYEEGDPRTQAAVGTHLPFGMPDRQGAGSAEHLLAQEHYLIWYDDDLRAPLWTADRLTQDQADDERDRKNSFRSDLRLSEDARSQCADYEEPIFDRGHMVPRSDMNRTNVAMDNTFIMSNMTPQHCAFNRGPWEVLEGLIRNWAGQVETTWIITGAVYDRSAPPGRDSDDEAWRMNGQLGARVAIPSAQYKIVARRANGGWETLSILLPNNDMIVPNEYMHEYIQGHVTTLNAIEQLSGSRFLQNATVSESPMLWPVDGDWPSSLAGNCERHYPER